MKIGEYVDFCIIASVGIIHDIRGFIILAKITVKQRLQSQSLN